MARLTTLFFDVGNTLLFPNRKATLAALHERGVFPAPNQLLETERQTKREFDALQGDGKIDHGFWHIFYTRLLNTLQVEDEALRARLVETIRVSANWCEIRPGTREILLDLARRYRLAVISNADGKIRQVLDRCGIADCFETITDSGLVGFEKPHPAIFQSALRSMNAIAEESLYIGDVCSVDYRGATGVGMRAILFDVCGAYAETNLERVESLAELQGKLLEK